MPRFIQSSALFLFVIASFCGSVFGIDHYNNVLVITVDTLRPDGLSCYGGSRARTPNIDSLASSGTLFKNVVSAAPLTLPSHVSLFTGLLPPVHGVRDNGFRLDPKFTTLADILKQHGLQTAAFVSSFSVDSRFGLNHGFDLYDDGYPPLQSDSSIVISERKAEITASAALQWLQSHAEKRWFVWIHFFDPHLPYDPPAFYRKSPSGDLYGGEIAYTDAQVGRIIDFLKHSNLQQNSLIVFTSDHGESLGEHQEKTHGIFAYESTLRVPLIVAPAHRQRIESRVRLIDVMPTIIDLLQIKSIGKIQGRSLTDFFNHGTTAPDDSYFEAVSMSLQNGWAPLRGFYSQNYKYIDLPLPELYDLAADPKETKNLCAEKDCVSWAGRFRKLIAGFPVFGSGDQQQKLDEESRARLNALGYATGGVSAMGKKQYSSADDPKTLIALHERVYEAVDLYNAGQRTAASTMLKQTLAERSDYSEAYLVASSLEARSRNPEAAAALLKSAIDHNLTNSEIRDKYGFYLLQAGKVDEAVTQLQLADKNSPADITHLNHLGMAYRAQGRVPEAESVYRRALRVDPTDCVTLNNLGALYLEHQRFSEAVTQFRAALATGLYVENSFNGLGVAYEGLKKWNDAIEVWNRALQQNPNNYDALLHLANDYLVLNNRKQALELFQRFAQSAPASKYRQVLPQVRALIRKLQRS